MQQPIWIYPSLKNSWLKEIVNEFNIHPVTAQILISRGFQSLEDIHDFLYAKLPSLHSPFLFSGMEKAVGRILQAISKQEKILIFGDNDVDGMTGTALLTEVLQKIGADVSFYLPNRADLKKNPIKEGIKAAKQRRAVLMITVDCGITGADDIEHATSEKIDVIVTDHHVPTSRLPQCIALLNPKLENDVYPNKELTGVGVVFKLAHAIVEKCISQNLKPYPDDLKNLLDLVALGTIADMGSLLGENRILVRYGLNTLKKTPRVGLLKLFSVCDLNMQMITPVDIASKIAPRLNSLGRIADPTLGVELLLCRDEHRAEELAQQLDLYNLERQKIERLAYEDISQQLRNESQLLDDKTLVLASNNWHPGIIPILSTKLAKTHNRPAIVIAIEEGIGKGSIRTIPEFPILSTLKEMEDLLLNYGGHDYAAGFSIKEEMIPEFKKRIVTKANSVLKEKDLTLKLFLDAKVDFDDLTFDFLESLNLLQPYGNENPTPVLYSEASQTWPPKIVGKAHLKIFLQQNDRALEGIAFNFAERRQELMQKRSPIAIAFTPYVNVFLNKSSIHLQIRDFRFI
jgi:single-stranded-DNA-specific exonuclease